MDEAERLRMHEPSYLQMTLRDLDIILRSLRGRQRAGIGGRKLALAITKFEEGQLWLRDRLEDVQQEQAEDQHGEGS